MARATARSALPAAAALCGLAALAAAPSPAAAGEGESALGLSLGYVGFSVVDHEPAGGGLALDYQRGVTDAIALRAAVLGAVMRADGTNTLGKGSLGVVYALDVLRYVPYVTLDASLALVGGDDLETELHPAIELGLGLDVLVGRSWSWGPFARVAAFVDESAQLAVGLRGTYRWGFF